jgi:hypothetical protein
MSINIQDAISFPPPTLLIKKFCAENDVSESEAKETFLETKKFLILCANDRATSYSPSNEIDEMWHLFMLHSKDYFAFCEMVGGYIHHQPTEKPQPHFYEKTLQALSNFFGEVNPVYWRKAGDCSSCH